MKNNKWKRIGSGILAVSLIATLLLSNQSFGVFAEEDGSQTTEKTEALKDGNSQKTDENVESDTVENTNGDNASTDKNLVTEENPEEDKSSESEDEAEKAEVQAVEGADTQVDTTDISKLIDADIALLKWKAVGGTATVTLNNETYNITDDESYRSVYQKVYDAMLKSATTITGDLGAQTITTDTIWNISGTVTMTGDINTASNRLVLLGTGTLTRNGDYGIISSGTVCLQGDVTADGNGDNYNHRFLSMKGNEQSDVELYLSDNFKIQNYVVCNQNGAGILGQYTKFYMSGGIVGSKDISFVWDDNEITKYGDETTEYLKNRENKGDYPYLKKINSEKGCKGRDLTGTPPMGGGIAFENSEIHMSAGSIIGNMLMGECETINGEKGSHGAGADFRACNVYITGGNISGNQSAVIEGASSNYRQYSGGIQIEAADENKGYVCELSNTEISYNFAQMWVGALDIYNGNTLHLKKGAIFKYNHANSNSGAVAIDGTRSTMYMEEGSKITRNHAGGLGAGVRCLGVLHMEGGEISYNSSVGNAAGLSIQTDEMRTGTAYLNGGEIHDNYSSSSGGGIGIVTGRKGKISSMDLNGTKVYNNKSSNNGGGIYIDANTGSVLANLNQGELVNNTAANGGGIYVFQDNDCNAVLKVTSDNLKIINNHAKNDGGGIYLNHSSESTGNISADITGGLITQNSSSQNGGGIYINSGNLSISGGSFINNTAASNGGGAYIADGAVRMFDGTISGNHAEKDGGGIYVSSENKAADVVIRSGNLTENSAGKTGDTSNQGNGGAIAVVSNNSANEDHVIIGVRKEHKDLDETTRRLRTSFQYADDKDQDNQGNSIVHTHAACPEITGNQATGNGGGIYMSSSTSVLDIYCLLEQGNIAQKDATGASIMSEGGKVNIGDIGDGGPGPDGKGLNNTENAVGNIFIQSKMLVKGGDIKLFGNTNNPKFAESILVDIEKAVSGGANKGSFNDYRYRAVTGKEDYKIEYFENFEGSGKFEARQYGEKEEIHAIGNMFEHIGWTILGWDTNSDAKNPTYTSNDLIPSTAWENVDKNTGALRLYAIWKKNTYTVKYDSNIAGVTVSGSDQMSDQKLEYDEKAPLKKNAFKVKGYRFVGWNMQSNGEGQSYKDQAEISKLTSKDGDEITLYAQWKKCEHTSADGATLSYKTDEDAHSITETCDCGGYTSKVTLAAEKVYYYDGKTHPVSLKGTFLNTTISSITYAYKKDADSKYGEEMREEPKEVGYYKAILTVGKEKVEIEYQIKSPADAAVIDTTIQKGQQFDVFTGSKNCTVAQDDAFTVQYNVYNLNAGTNNGTDDGDGAENDKVYKTVPVLTFSKNLPEGTTIIMQTNNEYWYMDLSASTENIALINFKKMGASSESFAYDTSKIDNTQSYRFIIDFSAVDSGNELPKNTKLTVGLKYAYTDPSTNPSTNQPDSIQDKVGEAEVTIDEKADFKVTAKNSKECTIEALTDIANTKYSGKNLVWKIKAKDSTKIPADAELTMTSTVDGGTQSGKYTMNPKGEFIIPFEWTGNQMFTFSLNSQQEAAKGSDKTYGLTATLCIGSSKTIQPKAVEDNQEKATGEISLQIPVENVPSLKISGNNKVVSKSKSLDIEIEHNLDLDKYSIKAVIQEKQQNGIYSGDRGTTAIEKGKDNYELGLQSVPGPGSYRVCIVISDKNNNTMNLLSTEPYYYFVVQ